VSVRPYDPVHSVFVLDCHFMFLHLTCVRINNDDFVEYIKRVMLQFGDKEKVWQLKLLNGSVYVRFGASVMPLDEFLANNDPCRGRFSLLLIRI